MALIISGTTGITDGDFDYEDELNSKAAKTYVDSKPSGFKNYIINGNFDVWQRGISQTSNGYGSDDRWSNENLGSTKTHSLVACTDTERALVNASKFSRTVVSSVAGSGNFVYKTQSIEDVTKLAGKTLTISFWAKADSTKNIALELQQSFGTGGSPSATVYGISSQLMSLTTIWQKKYITVTIPSIVGKTLGNDGVHTTATKLRFWFESGSDYNSRTASLGQQSGTFDIAQVQLEEGSVATPFENRPYGLELSLCQRYYEKEIICGYIGVPFTTGASYGGYFKMIEKRIVPTLSFSSDGPSVGFPVGIPALDQITKTGFRAYKNTTVGSGNQAYWVSHINANAEL